MIKKLFAILLSIAMLISLVACANDNNKPTQNDTPTINTESELPSTDTVPPIDDTNPTKPTIDTEKPIAPDDDEENPTEPTKPSKPTDNKETGDKEDTKPTKPNEPTKPSRPVVKDEDDEKPTQPSNPTKPSEPTTPTNPETPTDPTMPSNPTNPKPTEPDPTEKPTEPTTPTTPTEPSEPTTPPKEDPPTEDKEVGDVEDIPVEGGNSEDIEIPTPDIDEEVKVDTQHTALSANNYYQYSTLTASEKEIYKMLTNAIENTTNIIHVGDKSITYNRGLVLLQKVFADNPQYFWVSKSTSMLYNPNTNKVTSFILYYTDGKTTDSIDKNYDLVNVADRETINKNIATLNAKIESIVKQIPANLSQIEKEKMIHDYIVQTVTYDYSAAAGNYTYGDTLPHAFDIYGAVCEGKAVCEGYSKMFQYLCYCVGINATQIVGYSGDVKHMWNAVKIDGAWYQMDVTWNDANSENVPYYGYFNITEKEMTEDHSIETKNLSVPPCTATKYSVHEYLALKVTDTTQTAENYQTVIDKIVKEKASHLIITQKYTEVTQSYLKHYVLHAQSTLRQYANEKGYNFNFELKYRIIGDLIYIPVIFAE